MTETHVIDPVLEEMWTVKREIAAGYPSLDAYFQSFAQEQEARERQGVMFVSFPPRTNGSLSKKGTGVVASDRSLSCAFQQK